jgi:hypothetical protein
MYMQFNDAARIVMRLAEHEARWWGDERVDTQHLLLALMLLPDCVAGRVLARERVLEEYTRRDLKLLGPAEPGANAGRLPMARGLRKAIDLAIAAAERLGHPKVGTGHLLLGLLEEGKGVAFRTLCKAGICRLGENLSAVAKHVCAEMGGQQERRRRDEGERVVLPEAFPDYSPKVARSVPVPPAPVSPPPTNPPWRDKEDAVISFLSVVLMVVAGLNAGQPGVDVTEMSRFIDVALFMLGAAGFQVARVSRTPKA